MGGLRLLLFAWLLHCTTSHPEKLEFAAEAGRQSRPARGTWWGGTSKTPTKTVPNSRDKCPIRNPTDAI